MPLIYISSQHRLVRHRAAVRTLATHFVVGNVDGDRRGLEAVIHAAGKQCHGRFGSLQIDEKKSPSCTATTLSYERSQQSAEPTGA